MEKDLILQQKIEFIHWVTTLEEMSDEQWFQPLKPGTLWGTADIISHLLFWDRFVIENRLSFLLENKKFPRLSVDAEERNLAASNYARAGISKVELIEEYVTTARELVSLIGKIDPKSFKEPCLEQEQLLLGEYFEGLIQHEMQHKKQIESLMEQNEINY
ncbi:DinB family protein [Fictibacillus sp. BK138]|uniref:DinB family protein n=1 Tax=Fictibacillus sp. BK138 TaxID=2512121 RepID=UPI0010D93C66|nr:DinB family protein [Fictibacillus sp. BK138]RZT15510.1 DinB family protein [Fictibacillus sp. BK138]